MCLKVFIICIATVALTDAETYEAITEDVIEAFLKAHNDARAAVNVPPLVWDQTISEFASNWSSKCAWKHSGGEYGENIYASYPLRDNLNATKEAVKAWNSEIKNVDLPDWNCIFRSTNTCGHYSQVVWRDTQRVGCGMTHCLSVKMLTNFVVCDYYPPGNWFDEKPY